MIDITLPRVRWRVSDGPPGLKECPGRNDPAWGLWMIENLLTDEEKLAPIIVDPMCGGGQLWIMRPAAALIIGGELDAKRVDIARASHVFAVQADARTWAPLPVLGIQNQRWPHLVGFSFPYPNCDHNSGNVKNDIVAQKGAQSMQDIGPRPDPLRVFTQIANYCGDAPVAVIAKNYIEQQVEVDDVGLLVQAGVMAGLRLVEVYRVHVGPGMTESWKLARGEFNKRTGKKHRVVEHECLIVFRKE